MNKRISKDEYYLDLALDVAKRSTCLRRCYGAIIVNNDEIISTGYNGAPRGEVNCIDCGVCLRQEFNIKSGEHYELCRSVHAEANAIISASRRDMIGGTLYLAGFEYDNPTIEQHISYPCKMCQRLIKNAGIEYIVYRKNGEIQINHVGTFEHDDIISKDKIITIAKLCIFLDKIRSEEIFAQERCFINKINSFVYTSSSATDLKITNYKDTLLINTDVSYMINEIYRDLINEQQYDELTNFIKCGMNTKFNKLDEYGYHHKGNLNEIDLMKSILKYLTDKPDVSEYIAIIKSDIIENTYYFTLTDAINPYTLNAAWYLFYKLKNSTIIFD